MLYKLSIDDPPASPQDACGEATYDGRECTRHQGHDSSLMHSAGLSYGAVLNAYASNGVRLSIDTYGGHGWTNASFSTREDMDRLIEFLIMVQNQEFPG